MIERGYHSLFFPGGTRSRSGMVESRVKLGLAGTAIEAFARNLTRGVRRPVYFVPTTINYALVLEAETLIEDWLKGAGQARYIIEDDEFSRYERVLAFAKKLPAAALGDGGALRAIRSIRSGTRSTTRGGRLRRRAGR
jgi:glycerol-3-phosphate O-acyltransferase